MFDWAKGSTLKRFIATDIWRATWDGPNTAWLKNWSAPWFLSNIDLSGDLKVLDVGSAHPLMAQHLYEAYGCEAHAMDAPPDTEGVGHFGMKEAYRTQFPNIPMHYCLAGEDKLAPEMFDVIACVSAIEHTYDRSSPLDPSRPLAHMDALRDMCRMLKPGGLLLFNWDMYLDGAPHHSGWSYLTDLWLMQHCGMVLADAKQPVRSVQYIYNDPDTLFFAPNVVSEFWESYLAHGVSINAVLIKPGAEPRAKIKADTEPSRSAAISITTKEMEFRFRSFIAQAREALSAPIA